MTQISSTFAGTEAWEDLKNIVKNNFEVFREILIVYSHLTTLWSSEKILASRHESGEKNKSLVLREERAETG